MQYVVKLKTDSDHVIMCRKIESAMISFVYHPRSLPANKQQMKTQATRRKKKAENENQTSWRSRCVIYPSEIFLVSLSPR